MCFTGISFFARKTPKNHTFVVYLNKAVVRKADKRGILKNLSPIFLIIALSLFMGTILIPKKSMK